MRAMLGLIGLAAVVAALAAADDPPKVAVFDKDTAKEVDAAFRSDPAAARGKYKDRRYEVVGRVRSVADGTAYLVGNPTAAVGLKPGEAEKLKAGDTATLEGTFARWATDESEQHRLTLAEGKVVKAGKPKPPAKKKK